MKLLRTTKRSLPIVCLALVLNACAGGNDFPEDAVDGNNANNAANADDTGLNNDNSNDNSDNENGNNGNNANGNNLGNENGNNLLNNENGGGNDEIMGSGNEFLNNAAGNDFLKNEEPAAGTAANAGLDQNSTEDLGLPPGGAIVGENEDLSANIAPPNANMGATDTSIAPPSRGSSKPNRNGKVHYVLQNGSSAYDKANGTVVKTYEQGDHPVVTAEGEWVRTSEGMYVPSATLTSRPIPRAKSVKSWR